MTRIPNQATRFTATIPQASIVKGIRNLIVKPVNTTVQAKSPKLVYTLVRFTFDPLSLHLRQMLAQFQVLPGMLEEFITNLSAIIQKA